MTKVRSLTALATVTLVVAGMSPLARSDDKSTENNTEKPILCQGNYHSEADAVRQLAGMASTYSNLNEWRARARKLRTQILGGAKLDPLPARTPLKAVIRKKRSYDGLYKSAWG